MVSSCVGSSIADICLLSRTSRPEPPEACCSPLDSLFAPAHHRLSARPALVVLRPPTPLHVKPPSPGTELHSVEGAPLPVRRRRCAVHRQARRRREFGALLHAGGRVRAGGLLRRSRRGSRDLGRGRCLSA